MEITSLQLQDAISQLDDLFHVPGAVRKIIAISAYVDIESIGQLISFLSGCADSRGKASLQIFIDKSSSRFFSDRKTRDELEEKQNLILDLFSDDSGIFLVQFGKLFHSKIYLIEGNRKGKIILGSMNLTQKGINDNEEILLFDDFNVDGRGSANRLSNWVKKYSEKLKTKSTRADKNVGGNYPSCMRQFLLNGAIYYELKEQNPFRFKLSLPENIVKQQADIDRLLESSITDTISLETLISTPTPAGGLGKKLPDFGNARAYWKKYCVETCYGYWNPDLWNDKLASTLKNRIEVKKPYYDEITKILKTNTAEIKFSFIQLCKRIQIYLSNSKISDWKYGNLDKTKEAWDKWYKNLLLKLENEEFYNRLISGISSVPSPDVWSDPLSSAEFEESFYESIIYHWSKEYSKETSNVIAQAIAQNLDLGMEEKEKTDINKLKAIVECWLLENPSLSLVDFNEEE